EAAEQFRVVLAVAPNSPDAHYNLGRCDLRLNRQEEALAGFRTVIKLKPAFAEAYNNLGGALAGLGSGDEASTSFRGAARLKSDYAEPWFNLGFLDMAESQPALAVIDFQKAVALEPRNASFHYRLGSALSQVGETKKAIEEMRIALRL